VESIKIVCVCILAAVIYGIVHDQFTARICVEYFTVFHPPIFQTTAPTLLGIGWGIIATWWAGAIIGLLLVIAARFGSRQSLAVRDLLPSIATLIGAIAFCAVVFGFIGYLWAPLPSYLAAAVPGPMQRRLLADWWAHGASYGCGFLGGMVLCVVTWFRRQRSAPAS
jgi:hypothetical protein